MYAGVIMLLSLVVRVAVEERTFIPATHGEEFLASFLDRVTVVDKSAARLFHDAGEGFRPYTLSPLSGQFRVSKGQIELSPQTTYWFRITGVSEAVCELLQQTVELGAPWRIQRTLLVPTGYAVRAIDHPWAGTITFEGLTRAALHAESHQGDRIRLQFVSPTTFTLRSPSDWGKWMHLPLPEAVFGSLERKLLALCSSVAKSSPFDGLEPHLALGRCSIRTRTMMFRGHGRRKTGFVGDCEFLLDPSITQEQRVWLNLLSLFAFYVGVGESTSWGMGQAKREPAEEFEYRG